MTDAQKANLLKLHRIAAYREQVFQSLVAVDDPEETLTAARVAWETAETDLATYREYLGMLRSKPEGLDGRGT